MACNSAVLFGLEWLIGVNWWIYKHSTSWISINLINIQASRFDSQSANCPELQGCDNSTRRSEPQFCWSVDEDYFWLKTHRNHTKGNYFSLQECAILKTFILKASIRPVSADFQLLRSEADYLKWSDKKTRVMGLLTFSGENLSFAEIKKHADYIKEHGIIQFINTYNRVKNRTYDTLKWGDEVSLLFDWWKIGKFSNLEFLFLEVSICRKNHTNTIFSAMKMLFLLSMLLFSSSQQNLKFLILIKLKKKLLQTSPNYISYQRILSTCICSSCSAQ